MADFSPEQFDNQISKLIQNLAEATPDILQTIALDAKAKIQSRIQEKGQTAEETSFPAYSPKYKIKKQLQGKYVGFTNLTLTGGMFRRMGIISTEQQGDIYFVTVGGNDADSQNKINWTSDQYGDIMQVSDSEEQDLGETYNNEIQNVINESGFGK